MKKVLLFFVFYAEVYFGESMIHFYDAPDYKGEFFQINYVPYGIHDIPDYSKIVSVRTSDCVVLIENNGTQSDMSIVIEPLGLPNIENIEPGFVPSKYALCTDFYGPRYTKQGMIAAFDQNQTVSLDRMEGCFTFPTSKGQLQWIYNFGNCVLLYTSEKCQGNNLEIRGGVSKLSLNPAGGFKSMSFCVTCPGCALLNVTLNEIKLFQGNKTKLVNATVDLDGSTNYTNKGDAEITEFYSASKGLREQISFPRPPWLIEMNSVQLSPYFLIQADKNLTYIFNLLKSTLQEAFAKPLKPVKASYDGTDFAKGVITSYTVSQRMKLRKCTSFNLKSYVRTWENYPVDFELYFTIRDAMKPPVMTKMMIEDTLNDISIKDSNLEMLGEDADGSFLVKYTHEMNATFGQEVVVEAFGTMGYYCAEYRYDQNITEYN